MNGGECYIQSSWIHKQIQEYELQLYLISIAKERTEVEDYPKPPVQYFAQDYKTEGIAGSGVSECLLSCCL